MLKKRLFAFSSLFVIIAMLFVAVPAFALGTRHAKGKVIAINRRTHVMTVRNALGTKFRLKYSSTSTRLWHNGVRISLKHLHVGNTVDAAFSASSSTSGTANDVEDDNGLFEVHGIVAAVDTTSTPNTLSIASEDGGSTVILKVDSSTVITRNGAPATLADLLFGDHVEAKYNSATMLASSVNAEDEAQFSEIEGSISGVDTTAGTVTISGQVDSGDGGGSGTTTDVTLNVGSSTVIMLNGSPAPLSMLQVGMQAEAKYDPTTMNAVFLEAENDN